MDLQRSLFFWLWSKAEEELQSSQYQDDAIFEESDTYGQVPVFKKEFADKLADGSLYMKACMNLFGSCEPNCWADPESAIRKLKELGIECHDGETSGVINPSNLTKKNPLDINTHRAYIEAIMSYYGGLLVSTEAVAESLRKLGVSEEELSLCNSWESLVQLWATTLAQTDQRNPHNQNLQAEILAILNYYQEEKFTCNEDEPYAVEHILHQSEELAPYRIIFMDLNLLQSIPSAGGETAENNEEPQKKHLSEVEQRSLERLYSTLLAELFYHLEGKFHTVNSSLETSFCPIFPICIGSENHNKNYTALPCGSRMPSYGRFRRSSSASASGQPTVLKQKSQSVLKYTRSSASYSRPSVSENRVPRQREDVRIKRSATSELLDSTIASDSHTADRVIIFMDDLPPELLQQTNDSSWFKKTKQEDCFDEDDEEQDEECNIVK